MVICWLLLGFLLVMCWILLVISVVADTLWSILFRRHAPVYVFTGGYSLAATMRCSAIFSDGFRADVHTPMHDAFASMVMRCMLTVLAAAAAPHPRAKK